MLATGLAGCISPTPYQDARFGKSVTVIQAQQTLRPEASRNGEPVNGLDGKAAKGALDKYHDRFSTPSSEAPSVFGLSVSSPQQ
jgi:hypothetical protein